MTTAPGKIIRNIAMLDLRTATAETLAGIQRIDNAATVLYSAEQAALVTQLNIGNVVAMIKVPEGVQLINGDERLSRDSLQGLEQPLDLLITGQLTIDTDVSAEELRNGLERLEVYGMLLYPESLAGVIKSKLREVHGQAMAYPNDAQFVNGKLTLTESYLHGLADDSVLFIFGRLEATTLLPNDLLAQKIQQISMMGRVTCREENAETLLARTKNATRITTIPAGYVYLPKPLVIDANLIAVLPGRKLYGSTLRIEADVTVEALDNAIDALVVTDLIIAPAALRSVLAQKCSLLETEHVLYEGELWLIENETTFHASRFDYVEDKATLVIRGELVLADDIEPQLLSQHIAKVYNWGEIHCTPAQMSALQSCMGLNKGEFTHDAAEAAVEDDNVIGNTAYLVL